MGAPSPRQIDPAKLDCRPVERLYQESGNCGVYVAFAADGTTRFFPEVPNDDDPAELAAALAALTRFLIENPNRIPDVAGVRTPATP